MAKKLHPVTYALAVPLCGLAFTAAWFISGYLKKNSDAKAFPYASYQQNWASLQGNEYTLNCQIDQLIAYRESKGRVLAVKLRNGTERLPVFVPATLRQNFETGQHYRLHIRVRANVLYVEDAEKL